MRTILSLAVGFWLGRQLYIRYDKTEALEKEKAIREKLKTFLEEHGFTRSEAKAQANTLIKTSDQ